MKKHKLTGEGGKGSSRRHSNDKAYADNWELIFGKKPKPKPKNKVLDEKDQELE